MQNCKLISGLRTHSSSGCENLAHHHLKCGSILDRLDSGELSKLKVNWKRLVTGSSRSQTARRRRPVQVVATPKHYRHAERVSVTRSRVTFCFFISCDVEVAHHIMHLKIVI